MIRLSTAGHDTKIQNRHTKRENSGPLKFLYSLMLQVSLKLLRCKVNVSVLRNIIRIVIDALKVAFLIQETGLSNFDE